MRRVQRLLSLSVLAFALAVAAAPGAQQQPDRTAPPRAGTPAAFTPPRVAKRTLSNGLPVWVVELHKVPIAQVDLVVRVGSGADPQGRFGIASLAAQMLDEGAGRRGALELADAIDYLGASISTGSTFDASFVRLHVPAARLADALPLMADVALRPTFSEKELQRVREEILTSFVEAEDDPAQLVQFAFPRLVFGPAHRYGTAATGTPTALKSITTASLRQFHAREYVPANSLLVVAGDVTPDGIVRQLESVFGGWKRPPQSANKAVPQAPQLTSRQVYIIDKPGAAQSQIRIGWVGVPRSTADYFTLRVLNTVLGGAFTSRLNQNLREEHGYTYGARSNFDMRASAGPFYAAAGVQTDKTADALREFFKELEAIRKPISGDELEKARNYLALQLPRTFETTGAITATLAEIFIYRLPQDYFATYTARIQAVTSADVQRAAEHYIEPDRFAVVIVGDRKAVEAGVQALNLGPVKTIEIGEVMK